MEVSAFDMLFTRNVPHILENIFFSLDNRSYLSCFNVNRAWNELLSSQTYQAIYSKKLEKKEEIEKKLWHASQTGNVNEVRRLLSSGEWMDVNCVLSDSSKTPSTALYEATCIGYGELVQLLLDAGAEPDLENRDGFTPLLRSAQNGNKEVVKLLLERGADPNKASASKYKYTPLYWAARYGHKELVKLFLDAGADPNKAICLGNTPLHIAVYSGYKDMAELLLIAGAHPNNEDENGWTPLHLAVLHGQVEISQLLLEKGADPNNARAGNYKQTPLYRAKHYGHKELVKLLLEHGADPNMAGLL